MSFRTCSNEAVLPWLRTIVNIPRARCIGDNASCLNNQQIACSKVPVIAISDRNCAVDPPGGDIGEAQLQGQPAAVVALDSRRLQSVERLAVPGNARAVETVRIRNGERCRIEERALSGDGR